MGAAAVAMALAVVAVLLAGSPPWTDAAPSIAAPPIAAPPILRLLSPRETIALCDRVDDTLSQIMAALHAQGAAAGAAHNTTQQQQQRRPQIDLSSIRDMMDVVGCPVNDEEYVQPQVLLPPKPRDNHASPPRPRATRAPSNTTEPTTTSLSVPSAATITRTTAAPLLQSSQRRLQRQRREDPLKVGSCTFSSVVDGTCPPPPFNASLTITFEDETEVPEGADPQRVLAISSNVFDLVLSGSVHEQPFRFIVDNGDWTRVTLLDIEGLEFRVFELRWLNGFSSVTSLVIANNPSLDLDASGFALASQLVTFSLEGNSLPQVSDDVFAGMTALQFLNLGHNRIRTVPMRLFSSMPLLHTLFLNNNIITHVEDAAFAALKSLLVLSVRFNDLTQLSQSALSGLYQLKDLRLGGNPLQTLTPLVFSHLHALVSLDASDMLLSTIHADVFAATTSLKILRLRGNAITSLPAGIFRHLSQLELLNLQQNRLASLPPTLLQPLTSLQVLDIGHNTLASFPPNFFDVCEPLFLVLADSNRLTALQPTIFKHNRQMARAVFSNNAITSIEGVFADTPLLEMLDMDSNRLTRFPPFDLPQLFHLVLSNNPITHLPNVTRLPYLTTLRLRNHHITALDLTPVLSLTLIGTLELDAAPHIRSVAQFDASQLPQRSRPPLLRTLRLINVDATPIINQLQALAVLSLESLHIGWPGLDASVSPVVDQVCDLLADNVRELALTRTGFTSIDLCPTKTFDAVFLQNNEHLQTVTIHNALSELNVSSCPSLTEIVVPSVAVLDMSSTYLRPSVALCRRWGFRMLFARNMPSELFRTIQAARALGNCLVRVDVLDASGNAWLDQPGELARFAGELVALSDTTFVSLAFGPVRSRSTPPVLQLRDTPVECTIELQTKELRHEEDLNVGLQVVYSFQCGCSQGYRLNSNNVCEPKGPNIAAIVGGSLVGGLAILVPVVLWLYRRYWKSKIKHQQLLSEKDEEVMALKRAWEIEYDELHIVKRVAAGSFGAVFKAKWDTVTVAVKVLQQAVMALDEHTVIEFEKEVEFLQKTRHPNVVRFFGAGTDPNGSPFLVLEYVAMGSLKDLLGKDMEQVLREVRATQSKEGSHAFDAGPLMDTTAQSTHHPHESELATMTVWDLKLRLLRDVASGMAFIHSLDQMHRDLKSGNVLVSSSLRAKITDFGSIRQCLARSESSRSHPASAPSAITELLYTRGAGAATMHLHMTAAVGTPMYMAPEVFLGEEYNAKADVFSFGVLMWEVATQRDPDLIAQEKGPKYRGPLLATQANLLKEGKRMRFEDHEGRPLSVSEWYTQLAYQCMASDPADRPTFDELKTKRLAHQNAAQER
ncbi:TKL protein kinase [Salpingoeca rosetta]|uniref:TKL protein kinase n=1 Tax=Salpingoeca rosetta (strain ATCC 50818 / BSB-021) TaxID=946362 RepID=F2UN66_SALR5|nr:TKL protein kinase [Salpingoeca rosetta]EGD78565.1 TKL protein kinase [Salpingoeca rosetta]|eukprot:XP_004989514.1 TKL protein kinase [Salpingoeca rosetta]